MDDPFKIGIGVIGRHNSNLNFVGTIVNIVGIGRNQKFVVKWKKGTETTQIRSHLWISNILASHLSEIVIQPLIHGSSQLDIPTKTTAQVVKLINNTNFVGYAADGTISSEN